MKRCGLFVLYNETGFVEPYIEVLLESMKDILNKLIIVINGKIRNEEVAKLYKYSKELFIRTNTGYDGGAFKDIFLQFCHDENWTKWDEIVLINDTFYGPFNNWNNIFQVMSTEAYDFWGLTCHPGGKEALFDNDFVPRHVQSYFIVIKKRVIEHPAFLHFWKNLEYPKCYKDAVKNYEIYFSQYFMKYGFRFTSWMEVQMEKMNYKDPWIVNDLVTSIIKFHFPILKRKNCILPHYIELKKIGQYLYSNKVYPLEVAISDFQKRCENGNVYPYNPREIIMFCKRYKDVYLFGKGNYAKNIESFLNDNGIKIEGYIISKIEIQEKKIFTIDDIQITTDVGIIVALNKQNYEEIKDKLYSKVSAQHLITPIYE